MTDEVNPVLPQPKTSPTIPLLLILSIFSLAISGYLFWQNQQLMKQLAAMPTPTTSLIATLPSPTPIPSPVTDPTAGWNKYINTHYQYSLKYPKGWLAESFGPGANGFQTLDPTSRGVILSPNNQQQTVPNPMLEIQSEGPENLSRPNYPKWEEQATDWFTEGFKLIGKSTMNIDGETATLLDGKHVYPNNTTPVKRLIFSSNSNNGVYFTITIAGDTQQDIAQFDPILSTFKFTQ